MRRRLNDGLNMQEALIDILKPGRLTSIIDVGANPIDGNPPYKAMLEAGLCQIIGFEPQPEALARLRKSATENETYLPYALGDGREHTLHICRESGMTSLLEPDNQRLKLFNLFEKFGDVSERISINTVRLDDVKEINELDFLKIDVQGSELSIFSNGIELLRKATAVQTEVSFIPLYVNQPTFGQLDTFLRKLDFVPHCFSSIKRWALSPTVFNNNPRSPGNQLLEADIIYVKDFPKLIKMESEKIKHLAMVSHHIFRSFDLVNLTLLELEKRGEIKRDSVKQYIASFSTPPSK